ncbi:acyl-CoA dehydrogenase family protein [Yinghuangia sp. ASG 101]|uniref:acyl-CoA dehydrogenase family protein n=1 Tax=Yinghuangia sp. ASG 101 TaxID=2896848 RepID=UPI001E576411|nr:acyl-CoA dehydrogenase family protein [Yinghuangia sp. ASG 101]UGQ11922.1 acyl-CoA dehydrogenase family protein [Yinghuangia sp. ASG 101]
MSETPERVAIQEYRARARDWLAANLEPRTGPAESYAHAADKSEAYITEQRRLQRRVFEAGYAGITWPVEYGGQGLPRACQRAFDAEARRYRMPDFGIVGGTSYGVCAMTMLAHGSPEFLRRHIPRMLAGDELFVQFFSDPEAGSDLAGVRTQAVRRGDTWVLNGSKIWSSGAYYADWGMCLARTDWDVPKHQGLTWFAVPIRAKGVTVRRIRQINGNAEFCQEFFDDVELGDEHVIGAVNDGWTVTRTMLLHERGGGSDPVPKTARDVRRPAPDLVALAASRDRLDDPLAQQLVMRAHIDDVARAMLGRRLGALIRADPARAGGVASYGKLAAGTYDPIRANLALEIAEDAAVTWPDAGAPGADAATGLLNSRFMAIAGGTVEMQRNSIGERVLGLPREPSFDTGKPFREVIRDAHNWSPHAD